MVLHRRQRASRPTEQPPLASELPRRELQLRHATTMVTKPVADKPTAAKPISAVPITVTPINTELVVAAPIALNTLELILAAPTSTE